MAILKVTSGNCPGQLIELHGDRMIIGRHPTCHIVIDNAAVSRNHAQIVESHGAYFLEDLHSRNGTQLNGKRIPARTELSNNDEVRVCDMSFTFHLATPDEVPTTVIGRPPELSPVPEGALPAQRAMTLTGEQIAEMSSRFFESPALIVDESPKDSSSIISMLDVASTRHPRLTVRPEAKLQAVLEISKSLANTLDLQQVLPKLLESLFNIFPQADRGFVALQHPETEQLDVPAMRTRNLDAAPTARLSMTIINEAMTGAQAILSADVIRDGRFEDSESVASMRVASVMCAPLVSHGGESMGVIQLDSEDSRQPFSQDDLDLLASVAAQATLVVENARLHGSVLRKRDLERELEFANQVQLGFLPTSRPEVPGYEFHDFYEAAFGVGGDFFDYIPLPDGRIAMTLGDVAGKGMAAALLMARMYASSRYELLAQAEPADAMQSLNVGLVNTGVGHRFVTMVVAILDPVRHTLTLVNAGHLPPVLRNGKGAIRHLGEEESGLPLGIKSDVVYAPITVALQPGDMVLIFTDGVTEAMNAGNELYGAARFNEFLTRAPASVCHLGDELVGDIQDFCDDRPQRDDICMICLRRLP